MTNRINFKKIFTVSLPIIIIISCIILKNYFYLIASKFNQCPFNFYFHIYCPACGNTRCVLSLLKGDIFSAIHYNITPVFILFLLILLYVEYIITFFNKKTKLIPRKTSFWILVYIFFILYYILRNFIPWLAP